MNSRWILALAGTLVFMGCDTPKVEKYKFTPPPMPEDPFKRNENARKQLEDQLRETMKLLECKEAAAPKAKLNGNFDERKVVDLGGGKVLPGVSHPASYKDEAGTKGKLLHNGCPDDMVKAEAGGLEVSLLEKGGLMNAQKVLLCGKVIGHPYLMVNAGTLVLKDAEYMTAAVGSVSVKTGILKLEGRNSITATSLSGAGVALNITEFLIQVETGIEGDGTLKVHSKADTCEDVRKRKEARDKEEAEKAKG